MSFSHPAFDDQRLPLGVWSTNVNALNFLARWRFMRMCFNITQTCIISHVIDLVFKCLIPFMYSLSEKKWLTLIAYSYCLYPNWEGWKWPSRSERGAWSERCHGESLTKQCCVVSNLLAGTDRTWLFWCCPGRQRRTRLTRKPRTPGTEGEAVMHRGFFMMEDNWDNVIVVCRCCCSSTVVPVSAGPSLLGALSRIWFGAPLPPLQSHLCNYWHKWIDLFIHLCHLFNSFNMSINK